MTFREVMNQRIWSARPVTVVRDSLELTALLLVPGTPCKVTAGLVDRKRGQANKNSRWDEHRADTWQLRGWTWQRLRVLVLMRPGDYYAVWLCWDHASGEFNGWYVNFQLPFIRTPIGFDTFDLEIDLDIAPDYTWTWKDEAEYQEGVRRGAISTEVAERVGAARLEILPRLQAKAWPFDGSWLEWQPDEAWTIPQLHRDWARVEGA